MFPAFGSCEFSCVLEAVGTLPFLCSLAVFGGSAEGYVQPNYSSENSLRAPLGVLVWAYYEE